MFDFSLCLWPHRSLPCFVFFVSMIGGARSGTSGTKCKIRTRGGEDERREKKHHDNSMKKRRPCASKNIFSVFASYCIIFVVVINRTSLVPRCMQQHRSLADETRSVSTPRNACAPRFVHVVYLSKNSFDDKSKSYVTQTFHLMPVSCTSFCSNTRAHSVRSSCCRRCAGSVLFRTRASTNPHRGRCVYY